MLGLSLQQKAKTSQFGCNILQLVHTASKPACLGCLREERAPCVLSAATGMAESVNINRLSENSSNTCGGNKYTNNWRSNRLFQLLITEFYILAGWNFVKHIKNGMYLKTAQIYSFHWFCILTFNTHGLNQNEKVPAWLSSARTTN